MREVAFAKQMTEGEMWRGFISPPVSPVGEPAPSSEGAKKKR